MLTTGLCLFLLDLLAKKWKLLYSYLRNVILVLLKELRGNFAFTRNTMHEADISCRINGTGRGREGEAGSRVLIKFKLTKNTSWLQYNKNLPFQKGYRHVIMTVETLFYFLKMGLEKRFRTHFYFKQQSFYSPF